MSCRAQICWQRAVTVRLFSYDCFLYDISCLLSLPVSVTLLKKGNRTRGRVRFSIHNHHLTTHNAMNPCTVGVHCFLNIQNNEFPQIHDSCDRLCGLVVRVLGYRSRGPGSISDATRFSEKYWVWNGVHSAS
jgi:hypothetical protein